MISQQPTDPAEDAPEAADVLVEGPGVVRRSWYNDRILLIVLGMVLALDQLTKYIVRENLPLSKSWPEDGFFRFTHWTNSGTAFGLFPNQTVFLIIFSVGAIGFIYYFYRSHALPSRLLRLAMGLQLGGALGNLLDRVKSGAVVDFLDVGRWPIFNLADSAIVLGITLLIAITFFAKDVPDREDGVGEPAP